MGKSKKITKNLFLIAGLIFFIVSLFSFFIVKSKSIFFGGLYISVICIMFNYIYKVKWNEIARKSLLESCESLKVFGNTLPLKFLSKIQFIWVILLFAAFFKPLILVFFPNIPIIIFTIINNFSFSFILLGIFYQLLQGNLKGFSIMTGILSFYSLINVVYIFVIEKNILSINSMCLFIVFWSMHIAINTILQETEPVKEEKIKKVKKSKKEKQTKENKEIENKNLSLASDFIENKNDSSELN